MRVASQSSDALLPGTEVGRVGHFTVSAGHLALDRLPMLPSAVQWPPSDVGMRWE